MGFLSSIGKAFGSVAKFAGPIADAVTGNWGPLAASAIGYFGQNSANNTNMDIASANNAASIELANTSYQRRVKDLTAAGLNPMLAYTQGGAQVPNLQQARVENAAEPASRMGLNASQQALISSQIETQQSQAGLNTANAKLAAVQAAKTQAEIPKVGADIQNLLSQSSLNSVNYNKVLAEMEQLKLQGKLTSANVREVLSRTNLNNAEITKISAELPKSELIGETADFARQGVSAVGGSARSAGQFTNDVVQGYYDKREEARLLGRAKRFQQRR